MKIIPPVMNARYRMEKVNVSPGYIEVLDIIQEKKVMGRRLPRIPQIEKMLQFWTKTSHPCFAQVFRYLDMDNEYVAIMRRLSPNAKPLSKVQPKRLKPETPGQIFYDLIHAFQFLWDHKILHPNLDLSKIYYEEGMPTLVIGHEGSLFNNPHRAEEHQAYLDVRYTAPEVIRRRIPSPKGDIYYLGAMMHHFLTGSIVKSDSEMEDVTESNRKLKKEWDILLRDMVHQDPLERPDWAEIRERASMLLSVSATPLAPAWIGMEDEETIKILKSHILESRKKPQAVALQVHPGREMVRRLGPLTQWAEDQNFLVFHTWLSEKETRHYNTMNDILRLLGEGVVRYMNRPDLASELVPLSNWHNAQELLAKWRLLLKQIFKAMIPEYCDGVVLIIEDIMHMDKASLETLMNLSSWLGSVPFTLLVTGDVLAQENMISLKEHWQFDWRYLHPAPLNEKQLAEMIWYGDRTKEKEVNLQEIISGSRGEEVMTYYSLEEKILRPGIFKKHLRKVMNCLSLKDRKILKILSCSERSLSPEDIEQAFEIPRPQENLNSLTNYGYLEKDAAGNYRIYFSTMEKYCRKTISSTDKRAIIQILYDHECSLPEPDIVQSTYLWACLENTEGSVRFTRPIEKEVQNHFRLDQLWRIERCYNNHKPKGFSEMAALAECIRGLTLYLGRARDHHLLRPLNLCNRYFAKGDYEKALHHFRRLSGNRKLGYGFRAFLSVRVAECSVHQNDTFGVTRSWRKFMKMDPHTVHPSSMEELTTRFVVAMRRLDLLPPNEEQALEKVDPKLIAWIQGDEAFRNSNYKKAVTLIGKALKRLGDHYDNNWRGEAYNLYGKALHRCNRPKEAIWSFKKALACFELVENAPQIEDAKFNLACSEHLEGCFALADKTFLESYNKAIKQENLAAQSGSLFYLMASAVFLNDMNLYENYHKQHRRITRKSDQSEARLTGLSLRLHISFNHTKDEILENINEMEGLIFRLKPKPPLIDEANVALRIGYFALGKPIAAPTRPYPEWTAWRHNLLDFLSGGEQQTLPELVKGIGVGYLEALHLFILKGAVEHKMIPKKYFADYLLEAFEEYAQCHGANYSGFLKRHFAHLKTLGDVPREAWQSAIGIFENFSWVRPKHKQLQAALIQGLRGVWPFCQWGACINKSENSWNHFYGDHNLDVESLLANIDPKDLEGSLASTFINKTTQKTSSVLFLPIKLDGYRYSLIWLLNERAADHDLEAHYEPLFRFYAKLFEFLMGRENEVASNSIKTSSNQPEQSYGIIGQSPAIGKALQKINRYGPSDLNIFISGESGTGKELAANAIHLASNRARKPFRAVNCAHYSDTMVEAEIFGHAKGSFTGAAYDKTGILELVDGGTLFLDEIGDINPKVQSLLLRVIQEGEFSRVGEGKVRKVDIRFVTATNKDMNELIADKLFRKDLFYRLVDEEINLPPLRGRLEDIPLLTEHFRKKYEPGRKIEFTRDFFVRLSEHNWSGNIRELESYIRKIMVRWRNLETITSKECMPHNKVMMRLGSEEKDNLTLDEFDLQTRMAFISQRLALFNGNRTQTAKSLGISRQHLSSLITKYNLDRN